MKRARVLLILFVVALLALGSLSVALAQDATAAAAPMEKVDLTMWSSEDDTINKVFSDLFDQWAATNAPGSTITITNVETEKQRNDLLTAGLAGSGLPDLFMGPNDPIGVYVDAGIIQPLDDKFDLSIFNGTLAAGQLGGKTYGIPVSSGNHLMLMYNKKFVDKAPDTWDELVTTAKAVAQAHPDVQGFAYNLNEGFWFLPFVGGFGGKVYDDAGNLTMNTQPWVDAFQFVHDLKYKDEVVPKECNYDCADGLFKTGGVAMIINGDWQIATYLDTAQSPALGKDNLGIAPWPKLANGNRPTPYTSGKFVSIPVTTTGAKEDAILSWLKWMETDQDAVIASTVALSRLPSVTSGADLPQITSDPILSASAADLATGIGMPSNTSLRCMWDSLKPNLEAVEGDTMSAQDAANASQTAADSCVEALAPVADATAAS
jgi:arabinogalactan oligomer/maltooligosaccharide transport system substrate-binding protein